MCGASLLSIAQLHCFLSRRTHDVDTATQVLGPPLKESQRKQTVRKEQDAAQAPEEEEPEGDEDESGQSKKTKEDDDDEWNGPE